MNSARLFIVSAPSGCGKGTILHKVFSDDKAFYSVSCTTRSPRNEDTDGVTYHFIDKERFEKMIAEGGFLEYAIYAGNYYGTPRAAAEKNLAEGKDVVLEIETQGAFQVKKLMPEAVSVFILPPSIKELERRLYKRGTESEDVIAKRVSEAKGEIEKADKYDYVIMNDDLNDALRDFELVISSVKANDNRAEKFKALNMKDVIEEVLKNA